jgi:hypothetical protein
MRVSLVSEGFGRIDGHKSMVHCRIFLVSSSAMIWADVHCILVQVPLKEYSRG